MRRRTVLIPSLTVVLALVGLVAPALPTAAAPTQVRTLVTTTDPAGGGDLVTTTLAVVVTGPTRDRSSGPVEVAVPAGTQQVGLTWVGDPGAVFELRTRSDSGVAWSAPTFLGGEAEEGPDGPTARAGAGPLWLGTKGVAQVKVRLVSGRATDVRVDAMTWRAGPKAKALVVARPASAGGGPPIYQRSSWAPGGWNSKDPVCGSKPKVNSRLEHAIVHHTDGTNSYRAADVPGILAGIYRFHTGSRGWCDIAYNLLVDRFGGVWEGRLGGLDEATWGGHAQGFNTRSVGVAVLGTQQSGVVGGSPSAATMASLRDVLAWKLGSQGIDPMGTVAIPSGGNPRFPAGRVVKLPVISGHGDTGQTACPGDLLRARLPQLRRDVAARIAATADPNRWGTFGTGARWFTQLLTDVEGPSFGTPSRLGSSTSKIVRAGTPIEQVAAPLVISMRADNRIGVVDRMHRALWGRPATSAELARDVPLRDRQTVAVAISAGLLAGTEGVARYGHVDDAAFVTALYRNALGRPPSAPELAAQRAALSGGKTRADLVVVVSEAVEHRNRVAVEERVTVTWFALVRRAPSAAELRTWSDRLRAGGTDVDLVGALLASREYKARFRR